MFPTPELRHTWACYVPMHVLCSDSARCIFTSSIVPLIEEGHTVALVSQGRGALRTGVVDIPKPLHFNACTFTTDLGLWCMVGTVLAHWMPDGTERPIGYTSRMYFVTKWKKYSQLEKEGLACVFGMNHFHIYLLGHSFELITDYICSDPTLAPAL